MKNWKTTLSGLAAILAIGAKVYTGGGVSAEDVALVSGAIGLLFAKDKNVTGGTTPSTPEAAARVAEDVGAPKL